MTFEKSGRDRHFCRNIVRVLDEVIGSFRAAGENSMGRDVETVLRQLLNAEEEALVH